jgi:predicted PurR-regulated permease PerM
MIRTVIVVATAVIVMAALYVSLDALMLIYVSALMAMGLSPLVRSIERRRSGRSRVPRLVAILIVYLAVVTGLVLLGLLVLPPLIEQATALWARLPRQFSDFQGWLIRHSLTTHRITLREAVQNAPPGAGSDAVSAVNRVFGAMWRLVGGIFGVITIFILSFYLLVEAESLFRYLARFVREPRRSRFETASRQAVTKVSAWVRAQLVLAGVMGVFAAVGLWVIGVPYFYVVALIAAVGETIPIVGPIVAGVTAVAIALSVSPRLALTVGVYFLVLHQLESNVLVPKIMERGVGVSPVTVMIGLLLGGAIWGLVGAILAVPTAAILSVIVEEFAGSDGVESS